MSLRDFFNTHKITMSIITFVSALIFGVFAIFQPFQVIENKVEVNSINKRLDRIEDKLSSVDEGVTKIEILLKMFKLDLTTSDKEEPPKKKAKT